MLRPQAERIIAEIAQDWRGRLYRARIEPGPNEHHNPDYRAVVVRAWDVWEEATITFAMSRDWRRWKGENA